jgi:N-sulfoglucosamine sulfohydrolase
MMNRREFLAASAAQLMNRPPNILFCITDDQSWLHAGASWIRTPGFDRLAREGVFFPNAFVSSPSCGPSRASVLTGQDFYRLGSASMNHTEWRAGLETYPDLLAARGYRAGCTGKGWGPGNWRVHGRTGPPAGPQFDEAKLKPPSTGLSTNDYAANFERFLESRGTAPFCFWVGFAEPHRVFEEGFGKRAGKDPKSVVVPPFLPDTPEVRQDLADYAAEIEWADKQLARLLDVLRSRGELDDTIIVFTADNGMAFPRAKGNLYEYGARVPLAIRWGSQIRGGQVLDDLTTLVDLAPTLLEACGVARPAAMTGRSMLARLTGKSRKPVRQHVVTGIERHFPGSRPNGAGYPSRAVRTDHYLYIENFAPDRNPAGDRPGPVWPDNDPTGGFGDSDGGPSKTELCAEGKHPALFAAAFGKRPAVELYDVRSDPANLNNLAGVAALSGVERGLKKRLDAHLRLTEDPRVAGRGEELEAVMKRFPTLAPGVARQQEGRQ